MTEIGSEARMEGTPIRLEMPARPDNLSVIRQALHGVAETAGIEQQLLGDIQMAVTEACTNVILHAYEDGGPLEVEIDLDPEMVTVAVRDTGIGLSSVAKPDDPTRHLGLPMITALTSRLEIGVPKDGRGTEVLMGFALT